ASPSATGTVSASPSVTASASASPSATGTVSAAGTAKGALTDDFSAGAAKWTTLTGTWEVADGVYRQTDASGYDFITQFTGEVPAACTVTVKIRPAGDKLGAGLLLGQPRPGTRSGATLVDVTDGSYLRWGAYSSGGTYQFTGGNALPGKAVKGQWHVLRVEVSPSRTVLFWDDRNVGEIKPIGKGRVGLVTSVSAVDFDDFSVTPA
ncbi:MAG: hypothetical protein QG622_2976, partial [Actinomycetota bacterium]|nr:hypothetical protein [Actinomycetota bacterium]